MARLTYLLWQRDLRKQCRSRSDHCCCCCLSFVFLIIINDLLLLLSLLLLKLTALAQIRLRIRAVWSGPSLSAHSSKAYFRMARPILDSVPVYNKIWPGHAFAETQADLRLLFVSVETFHSGTRPNFSFLYGMKLAAGKRRFSIGLVMISEQSELHACSALHSDQGVRCSPYVYSKTSMTRTPMTRLIRTRFWVPRKILPIA